MQKNVSFHSVLHCSCIGAVCVIYTCGVVGGFSGSFLNKVNCPFLGDICIS